MEQASTCSSRSSAFGTSTCIDGDVSLHKVGSATTRRIFCSHSFVAESIQTSLIPYPRQTKPPLLHLLQQGRPSSQRTCLCRQVQQPEKVFFARAGPAALIDRVIWTAKNAHPQVVCAR